MWLPCLLAIFLCRILFLRSQPTEKSRQVLVVTGNFTLNNRLVNIAEYDIQTGLWSTEYLADLVLYGASNGIILDMAVNRSDDVDALSNLYVVGDFDSVSELSQIQYCSVGEWDGLTFSKVGEGLCPRGQELSQPLRMETVVLGNDGDLFVGGSFQTREWNGKQFAEVKYVAQFNGNQNQWLPLGENSLNCSQCGEPIVYSLSWDSVAQELYIGGNFDLLGTESISPGIAIWSNRNGLRGFPCTVDGDCAAGLRGSSAHVTGIAISVAFDHSSESLFVAGDFTTVGKLPCATIAVWSRIRNEWLCLYQDIKGISTVTAMHLDNSILYLSGWASISSDWQSQQGNALALPYAISTLDLTGYIAERSAPTTNTTDLVNELQGFQSSAHSSYPFLANEMFQANSTRYNRRPPRWRRLQNTQIRINRNYYRRKKHNENIAINPYSDFDEGFHRKLRHRLHSTLSSRYVEGKLRVNETSYSATMARSNTIASSPPHAPLPPHPIVWMPSWQWLKGFQGTNGPVLRISKGSDEFSDLLIVGAFNNYPPVLIWSSRLCQPGVNGITDKTTALQGLITSAAFATLPYFVYPTPAPPSLVSFNDPYLVLSLCVLAGIIVGVLSTVGCSSNYSYSTLPKEDDGDDDVGFNVYESGANLDSIKIPLAMLDGTGGGVDFQECFQRAMKARHLPTSSESLLMINPQEIVLAKIIGEGSFGRVWSGQWRNNSVAVKEFVFAQTAIVGGSIEKNNIIQEIVGEAGIMALMHHPKILNLFGCSLTMQAIWIVSELCVHGSLRMVLNNPNIELTEMQKISLSLDIADGMMYMHTRFPPIIHRDLKSQNIFITTNASDNSLVAKIGDWGSARAIALSGSKSMTRGVGTACWLAPEVICKDHFSKESDIYAYGIILWEIFTRSEVYDGFSAAQIVSKVAYEGLRPTVPSECRWSKLMTACWRENPSDRPGFGKILTFLSKLYSDTKKSLSNDRKGKRLDLAPQIVTSSILRSGNHIVGNYDSTGPVSSMVGAQSIAQSNALGKPAKSGVSDKASSKQFFLSSAAAPNGFDLEMRVRPSSSVSPDVSAASIDSQLQNLENRLQQTLLAARRIDERTDLTPRDLTPRPAEGTVPLWSLNKSSDTPKSEAVLVDATEFGIEAVSSSPSIIRGRIRSDPLLSSLVSMETNARLRDEAGCRPLKLVKPITDAQPPINAAVTPTVATSNLGHETHRTPFSLLNVPTISPGQQSDLVYSPLTPYSPGRAYHNSSSENKIDATMEIPSNTLADDDYSITALSSVDDTVISNPYTPVTGVTRSFSDDHTCSNDNEEMYLPGYGSTMFPSHQRHDAESEESSNGDDEDGDFGGYDTT